ncbi:hypothetical protein SDC9_190974 [bioreactor metagenome]|uniref:Uncharacterized protein n=1 Tax=bioreactor metagenome TaxID=1076179 RepID=A0A645I4S2_9ZZZZ
MVDLAGPGEIGHVDHTVQTVFELNKRTVAGEVADFALDLRTRRIFLGCQFPGVGFELADGERDFLLFAVGADDNGFDIVTHFEDVGSLGDALGPGEFGHVDQTLDSRLQFDKCAVGNQVDHFTFDM